jgi:hypothetical protein
MAPMLDADARHAVEDRLMELDGVLHVSMDTRSDDLWVVRDPSYEHGPVELAVRNRLAAMGQDPARLTVHITLPAFSGPRRRVRFVRVERVVEHGLVSVVVHLEWDDVVYTGTATGERGPALELKTTAQAAIEALERLSKQELSVRIIGVKSIHAFDSDLMVASLLRVNGIRQRLVGAVVVKDDPLAAAALAVLSALNRTLGNFLHTTD